MIDAVEGPGGLGGDTQPAMAISIAGREFVLQRAEDYIADRKEPPKFIPSDKSDERLLKRNTPGLLR